MQGLKQIRSRAGDTLIEKRDSETRKRSSNMGFRKPNFKIGVSQTKTQHRGMKNEIRQVGYFKRSLIGGHQKPDSRYGVRETKFQRWGTIIQSEGKGSRNEGLKSTISF